MLLALFGCSGVLVASSAAFPISAPYALNKHIPKRAPHPLCSRHPSKRDVSDNQQALESWVPDGVAGHIDLMTNPSFNNTASLPPYDPYTTIQSIPSSNPSYKIAEMAYNRPIFTSSSEPTNDNTYLLNAKPFGWGTKFWMLKSHDVDCYAGSEFASSYNSSSQIGTEYPVILRSPLGTDCQDGVFAYCATYDPNPRGSRMNLGAAPCGRISCAPLPLPEATNTSGDPKDSTSSFSTVSRNPDGTFAPTFFSTRPCNYLDSNCHVSQIFLYNAMTGAVRPMYHTGGMAGANSTRNASGEYNLRSRDSRPEPLWKSVEMVFRQGDLRALQGWPDPDPALVVADPAFDKQSPRPVSNSSQPGLDVKSATKQQLSSDVMSTSISTTLTIAELSQTSTGAASAVSRSVDDSLGVSSEPKSTLAMDIRPVWLVRPRGAR